MLYPFTPNSGDVDRNLLNENKGVLTQREIFGIRSCMCKNSSTLILELGESGPKFLESFAIFFFSISKVQFGIRVHLMIILGGRSWR